MHKIKTFAGLFACLLFMFSTSEFLKADVTANVTKNVTYSGVLELTPGSYAAKIYYDDGSVMPFELPDLPIIVDLISPLTMSSTKGQRDPFWPQYLIEENGYGPCRLMVLGP